MFPILNLAGEPRVRGRQYGAQAVPQIRHSIASYARLFAQRRGMDWASSQAEALRYVPLLADYAGDLLEEMQGVAEGAGVELAAIVALNVRTELLAGVGHGVAHPESAAALARNRAAGVPQHADEPPPPRDPAAQPMASGHPVDDGECTTVAVLPEAGGAGTLLAQTWDWNGDQRAACVLLRIVAPGQPTVLTLTEAGILAKIGMNSAGVAVSLNLLRSRADGATLGMAVHVLLRAMLQTRSLQEAQALAARLPAGASSCITIAEAGRALSLELAPGSLGALLPQQGLLAHTNHCLDAATSAGECPLDPTSSSRQRLDRAALLLAARRGKIDVAALQALLRDHDGDPFCICRHPDLNVRPVDRSESVCAAVMDLDQRVMHVAPGIPCQVAFTPVALTEDDRR